MLDFCEGPAHSSHRVLLPLFAGPGWKQGWGRYSGHGEEQKPKVWGLGTGSGTNRYSCHLAIDWGWVEPGSGCGGDRAPTLPLSQLGGLLHSTEGLDFFKERGEKYDWDPEHSLWDLVTPPTQLLFRNHIRLFSSPC